MFQRLILFGLLMGLPAAVAYFWPSESPPQAPPAWLAEVEANIFAFVNEYRQDAGSPPLVQTASMQKAARSHSKYMADTGLFEHSKGQPYVENILQLPIGFMTSRTQFSTAYQKLKPPAEMAANVASRWFSSPKHRAALLDPLYRFSGVGLAVVDSPNGNGQLLYGAQTFQRPE